MRVCVLCSPKLKTSKKIVTNQSVKSSEIKKIVDLILSSKKPIFYGGGGIINSGVEASQYLKKIIKYISRRCQWRKICKNKKN